MLTCQLSREVSSGRGPGKLGVTRDADSTADGVCRELGRPGFVVLYGTEGVEGTHGFRSVDGYRGVEIWSYRGLGCLGSYRSIEAWVHRCLGRTGTAERPRAKESYRHRSL